MGQYKIPAARAEECVRQGYVHRRTEEVCLGSFLDTSDVLSQLFLLLDIPLAGNHDALGLVTIRPPAMSSARRTIS